jgi:hypothetical protein
VADTSAVGCPPDAAKAIADLEEPSSPMVISLSSRSLWTLWKEGNKTILLEEGLEVIVRLVRPPKNVEDKGMIRTNSSLVV